jgi:hypothetical protein
MTVELESVEDIARVYKHGGTAKNHDRYDGVGSAHYHDENAVTYAFHGGLGIHDILSIYRQIRDKGKRWLLAQRADGHTIPLGQLMPEGRPFEGWWYVDLTDPRINED